MRTDVGVIISDTHILAETALCPPDAIGDDGAKLTQNKAQRFIWQCWTQTLQRAETELTPIHGGKRWLFHLGDILEGLHHDSTQVATLNMATMRRISAQTLEPWVKWSDYTFLLRGTPAHGGHAAADEETIGDILDARVPRKIQRDTVTGMTTTFHRRVQVGKATFDLAHHPVAGTGREYLSHGPAGTTAVSVLLDYLQTHDTPPTVAARGHLHPRRGIYDSGLTYATRCIVAPCWKLIDEFGSKRTPGSINVIGAVFFTVQAGQVNLWPVIYTPKRSRTWTEPTTTSP